MITVSQASFIPSTKRCNLKMWEYNSLILFWTLKAIQKKTNINSSNPSKKKIEDNRKMIQMEPKLAIKIKEAMAF